MSDVPINQIICGDVIETLKGLPAGSVQCVITSPPYWGLRDYGIEPRQWPTVTFTPVAGLPEMTVGPMVCVHSLEPDPWSYVAHAVLIFREVRRVLRDDGVLWLNLGSSYASIGRSGRKESPGVGAKQEMPPIARNIDWKAGGGSNFSWTCSGFKPKDLIDIPHIVAHALQADGWWLRQAMPWVKRNPMPGSETDRPTNGLEFVFLLTKKARYYFDMEAVRMEGSGLRGGACFGKVRQDGPSSRRMKEGENESIRSGTRAYRNTDLWYQSVEKPFGMVGTDGELVGFDVLPQGFAGAYCRKCKTFYKDGTGKYRVHIEIVNGKEVKRPICPACGAWDQWMSHFATFGTEFVRPLLKAGTSAKGACPKCGAPWERVVEKNKTFQSGSGKSGNAIVGKNGPKCQGGGDTGDIRKGPCIDSRTVGWRPTCKCYGRWYTYRYKDGKGKWHSEPYWRSGKHPKLGPCVVLDLFGGSGTVGYVAAQEKRDYVLIEVNPEYCDMARKRLAQVEELPLVEAAPAEKGLFGQS